MGRDANLVVSDILDILASSKLPKTEWPGILRAVIDRISPPTPSLPKEVVKRRPADVPGKGLGGSAGRASWKGRTGADRTLTLPEFILKHYRPEIEARTLTKATLRADRDLYRDFYAWQRHHELPPELQRIPTKKKWNDQRLAEAGMPGRLEDIGLYEAARYRATRARTQATRDPRAPKRRPKVTPKP